MTKSISILLLVCLLFLQSGICSAAEKMYQISDSQLTTLEQNSVTLREKTTKLENELMKSQTDSKELRMELDLCQVALKELDEKATALAITSTMLKENLEASQKSLTKMTEYINQLEKQAKSKIKKLTVQRNVAIGALLYALFNRNES